MRHVVTFALLALGLLVIAIACDNGDQAPAVTDTPMVDATASLAEPAPRTPRPDVDRLCPIDDESFCEFAEDFDRASGR